MSTLYIANCSQQPQVVSYRLDINSSGEKDVVRLVHPPKISPPIPAGRQAPIGGDLHPNQISAIVDQLAKYGLHAEDKLGGLNGATVAPYIYSIDKPVGAKSIRDVMAYNRGVLTGQGKMRREAAAVAISQNIESDHEFEVGFEQESVSSADEDRVDEVVRVVTDVDQVPGGRRKARRAA